MDKKLISVTIITGFLGAGKTTLTNEILRKNPNFKFLIIENEAGEINIDGELLEKRNKNVVFELSSGCICCSLNTELATLLNSIILSNVEYDYMLIEATGVADPKQIINMFSGARVQRYFRLDGIVSLVDAGLFLRRLNSFNEIRRQVALSDIVIINKVDLVTTEKLEEIRQQVKLINPFARIENTTHGNIESIQILDSEMFHYTKVEKFITDFSNLSLVKSERGYAHQIQTLSFSIPGYFKLEKFSWWLENFLFANAGNILRIKGILSIEEMKHKIVLQSVGDNFHVSQGTHWHENEDRISRIVFIGTKLDEDELRKNLYSLLQKIHNIET